MEKLQLPLSENQSSNVTKSTKRINWIKGVSLAAIAGCYLLFKGPIYLQSNEVEVFEDACPEVKKMVPEGSEIEHFHGYEYRNKSLKVWGDAVRIPTENFDDLGEVGEDSRWDIFYKFKEYLDDSFPAIVESSKIERVNTHGLVYTIKGTNEDLKPIMLCGHQDVVPVPDETMSRWTHPPYEAVFDGDWLWGRGSSDCKNNVIAVFEALEELLSQGFKLKRTVIIALGFDEETSGLRGAANIGKFLTEKLGDDSVFMIIDEGGLGVQDIHGGRLALPATGEKGYVDYTIDFVTTGGHSSMPPRHTGIGIIADLIHQIELDEYPMEISPKNPLFTQLQCEAKAATSMPKQLKKDILALNKNDKKAKERIMEELTKTIERKVLVSTTQAVDIIVGGLKINALPEKVTVKINHRVSYDSSLDEVRTKILKAVDAVAETYDLDIESFGKTIREAATTKGLFKVYTNEPLIAAPLTPTVDNPSWDILGGSIRHVFEDFAHFRDNSTKPVTVSPSCMTGNTDTRHYWNLTNNIYRFSPIRQIERLNAHAIDERVSLDAHIEGVVFFYQFLKNLDTYEGN